MAKTNEARQAAAGAKRKTAGVANDRERVGSVLRTEEKRLRRIAGRRAGAASKQTYRAAADHVKAIASKLLGK